jgi:hypothetical protein
VSIQFPRSILTEAPAGQALGVRLSRTTADRRLLKTVQLIPAILIGYESG